MFQRNKEIMPKRRWVSLWTCISLGVVLVLYAFLRMVLVSIIGVSTANIIGECLVGFLMLSFIWVLYEHRNP
jgi:hypothetical protein